jgi:hypothetical protein
MAATTTDGWVDAFKRATNEDPEIQAHGKYYTCSYLLDMEERSYVVQMESGKVANIYTDAGPLDYRYQFSIHASADTWRKMSVPTPEPMYHGIWAASFQRDMRLEGDLLVMMQNLRCLTRQIELLRQTGAPV